MSESVRRYVARLICPEIFKEAKADNYRVWYTSAQIGELIHWMPLDSEISLAARWLQQTVADHLSAVRPQIKNRLPSNIWDFREFIQRRRARQS